MKRLTNQKLKIIYLSTLILVLTLLPTSAIDSQLVAPDFGDIQLSVANPPSNLNLFYFSHEFISPTITLISPSSGSEDTDGFVIFSYSVFDNSNISNCSLYLDNTLTSTKHSTDSFSITPPLKDNLAWFISCTDMWGNIGNSATWYLDTKLGSTGGGGGGGGTGVEFEVEFVDIKLCNLSYELEEYTQLDAIELQEKYLEITGNHTSINTINFYLENWQSICSDELKKTRNEEFVCNQIFEYININKTVSLQDISNIQILLEKTLTISEDLVFYYVNNYNELCFDTGLSPEVEIIRTFTIIGDMEIESAIIWLILIVLIIALVISFTYMKKKKILFFQSS